MSITNPLLLPEDVELFPVTELSAERRESIECADGAFVATRPRARGGSKVLDADTAELVAIFREPKTIGQAIIQFCRKRNADPEETLKSAYPVLCNLINSGLLVDAQSLAANRILESYRTGDRIAGYEVLECMHILEDTEIYKVKGREGGILALKTTVPRSPKPMAERFERECEILRYLEGDVAPKLHDSGVHRGQAFIVMEWVPGVYPGMLANELRSAGGRRELLELCRRILLAYANLHAKGVIHSDVHPKNLLVDAHMNVRVVDFGHARIDGNDGGLGTAERGADPFFNDPELAGAIRAGGMLPQSTMLGEQYSLAALLYLLITGYHYVKFPPRGDEVRRRICEVPPYVFSRWGVTPWPEFERVLFRALAKSPAERYPSLTEFAGALVEIPAGHALDSGSRKELPPKTGFCDEVLHRLRVDGDLFANGIREAPTCSVYYGAAGIAYFLYRVACLRDDPECLALSDLWAAKAAGDAFRPDAFISEPADITAEVIGRVSPYHTSTGIAVVEAMIGNAMGEFEKQARSVRSYLSAVDVSTDELDLGTGRASVVLGCAILLETFDESLPPGIKTTLAPQREALRRAGTEQIELLWKAISTMAPIGEDETVRYLGMAHGWAGLLYTTLRWCDIADCDVPQELEMRLEQLASCAEPHGRGLRWRMWCRTGRTGESPAYLAGWCHGTAGYVHLWTLAHAMLGDDRWMRIAEQTAWNVWEQESTASHLCCGTAGRAYALLNLYKHTNDPAWLQRARQLAGYAVRQKDPFRFPDSLYKGEIGIALLDAEMDAPARACFPFFERDTG